MENLTQFAWPRALGQQYVWQKLPVRHGEFGKAQNEVRILTFPTPAGSEPVQIIHPLAIHDALLWRFSEVDPQESAITKFANSFGLLAGDYYGAVKNKGPTFNGDPLFIWETEILRARRALAILKATESGDKKTLAKWIHWSARTGSVSFKYNETPPGEINTTIASPELHPETLALFEQGDLVLPARIMLARIVNEQVAQHASPQLLWSRENKKLAMFLRPKNLLGAMWVQFGLAIDGRKDIARCENCGTWFERVRKDKRYCSAKCRVYAMRERNGESA